MSLAPDQIRSRTAVHVLAAMAPLAYVEATVAYGVLPDRVSRQEADRCFAVGILRSERQPDRQRGQAYMKTGVGLRALVRVRAEEAASDAMMLNDEDVALKDEVALVHALASVKDTASNPELALQLESIDRRFVADGTYVLLEIATVCFHSYPL